MVVAALAALAGMIATAGPGPLVTPDSVDYLSSAGHLADGDGLVAYDGELLVLFPPGFPAVVAALSWTASIEPLLAARIVNSVAFATIVVLGWLLVRRHVDTPALRLAGVVAIAAGAPLAVIVTAAWSAPLFVVAALAALLLLEAFLDAPERRGLLIGAAAAAAAAFYFRHVGIAVVITGCAALLLAPDASLRRRIRWTLGFGALASALIGIWLARNLLETSSLVGDRLQGGLPLGTAIEDAFTVISAWFLPASVPDTAAIVVLLLAAVSLGYAAVRAQDSARRSALAPLALFTAIFVALMIASAVGTELDRLDDRLLSPVYVPGVVLALAAADSLFTSGSGRWMRSALGAAVVVAVGLTATTAVKTLGDVARDGGGYTTGSWRDSPVLALLGKRAPDLPVFSNRSRPVAFVADVDAACWPGDSAATCKGSANEPIDIGERVREAGGGIVVWVKPRASAPEPLAPPGIAVVELESAGDGSLYCAARESPAPGSPTPGCRPTFGVRAR
jgi:hypothetical protein